MKRSSKMKLIFVLLALSLSFANSYKILGVFPIASKSHYAIGEATMKALHGAGHEVTMISVFEQKKPLENYHQITIESLFEKIQKGLYII